MTKSLACKQSIKNKNENGVLGPWYICKYQKEKINRHRVEQKTFQHIKMRIIFHVSINVKC